LFSSYILKFSVQSKLAFSFRSRGWRDKSCIWRKLRHEWVMGFGADALSLRGMRLGALSLRKLNGTVNLRGTLGSVVRKYRIRNPSQLSVPDLIVLL
jgi:hypothetical protein